MILDARAEHFPSLEGLKYMLQDELWLQPWKRLN